jgi:PDZ domain
MINNGFHPHVWFKKSKDVFRKNIVSARHKDIRLDDWGEEIDCNFFPDKSALDTARGNETDGNSTFGDPMFENPGNMDFSVKDDSPAFNLGFLNFNMEMFGVKSPGLKRIAAVPDTPELILALRDDSFAGQTRTWLGAEIRNIETMAERSASGLSRSAGVIITDISSGSPAADAGLKKGDVIIRAEGEDVDSIPDLLRIHQENNWTGKLSLVISRNQGEESLVLKTK